MNYIRDHVKRQADKTYHENSKHFKSSVIVHRADGTSEPVNKNYIVLNDLNHFEGWECSVGVENLSIQFDGAIMANCGTNVYGLDYRFNLNDADFVTKFTPEIKPVICPKYSCDSHEYNLNKRVIPIIALT